MTDPISVTVDQAAQLTNVSRDVIYAAVKSGSLRAKRVGIGRKRAGATSAPTPKAIRIDYQALRDWFNELEDVAS